MHELGVIFYVVRDVKKVAEENNVKKISAVTLEIGEVTGITFLPDEFDDRCGLYLREIGRAHV